eukprot:7135602-Prymnesium_polylepis.2
MGDCVRRMGPSRRSRAALYNFVPTSSTASEREAAGRDVRHETPTRARHETCDVRHETPTRARTRTGLGPNIHACS